jgi:glutathione S-transferase
MAWQHGGLGPMQGQANHFNRFTKEKIAYGMQRYTGETERLVGVLDNHLKDKEYLVGNKYSIADIASWGWVNILRFSGVELDDFPNVKAWWARINARPAVQKGTSIPSKGSFGNDAYLQRLKDDEEFAKSERELKEKIAAAKKEYGYKFSTP